MNLRTLFFRLSLCLVSLGILGARAGAREFVAEAYGVRVDPGEGWSFQTSDEGVLFRHTQLPGLVLGKILEEELEASQLKAAAREGLTEGRTRLKARREPEFEELSLGEGSGLAFSVEGVLEGQEVRGRAGLFLPPGAMPILFLAVSEPKLWPKLAPGAQEFLKKVRLFAGSNPQVRAWDEELRGKKVEYLWSYSSSSPGGGFGSTSQNRVWHLCQDGSYWYQGRSHLHLDTGNGPGSGPGWSTGSARGRGQEWGQWKILPEGDQAVIWFGAQTGGEARYRLSKRRKRGTSFRQKFFGELGVYAAEAADCSRGGR